MISSGDKKEPQDISSPLFNFNFPRPPPVTSTPITSVPEQPPGENSDYDIPRPLHSTNMGEILIDQILYNFYLNFIIYNLLGMIKHLKG